MIDPLLIERIHEDLEGRLSAEDSEKLQADLNVNSEASLYYRQWRKIIQTMEKNREAVSEINLSQEILNRISMETTTHSKPEPLIRPSLWERPPVKYSLVFMAGVLIGLLIFTIAVPGKRSNTPPASQLKGTMYDSRSFDQMKVADNLMFENSMIRAGFDVRYSTSTVEARISLSSLYPVQALIQFDYNSLQVMNVVNVSVNDQSNIMAAPNYVQLNNSGNNQYVIQLMNKNNLPHQISIKLVQNDVPFYQNAVTVNRE